MLDPAAGQAEENTIRKAASEGRVCRSLLLPWARSPPGASHSWTETAASVRARVWTPPGFPSLETSAPDKGVCPGAAHSRRDLAAQTTGCVTGRRSPVLTNFTARSPFLPARAPLHPHGTGVPTGRSPAAKTAASSERGSAGGHQGRCRQGSTQHGAGKIPSAPGFIPAPAPRAPPRASPGHGAASCCGLTPRDRRLGAPVSADSGWLLPRAPPLRRGDRAAAGPSAARLQRASPPIARAVTERGAAGSPGSPAPHTARRTHRGPRGGGSAHTAARGRGGGLSTCPTPWGQLQAAQNTPPRETEAHPPQRKLRNRPPPSPKGN